MKTIATLTAAVALLTTGAASAADMYSQGSLKDAPSAQPTWTGFYASVGVGGHFVDHALSVTGVPVAFDGIAAEGVGGRFGLGVDYQVGPRLVVGLFGDCDVSNASTTLSAFGSSASIDLNYLWTVGGRAGVLLTPSTLTYALVGYSEGQFEGAGAASGLGKLTSAGFTVGGGVEQQLGSNFSLKGEYRFTSLDTQTIGGVVAVNSDVQSVFASLAYKIPVGRGVLN
jgi:outer membrane immunogenic protein